MNIMKKAVFTLFTLLLGFSVYAQDLTKAANLAKYNDADTVLPGRVVFIGNSITEGWVRNSPEFFESNGYIGRGIGGQTSPQLLMRFRQDVLRLNPAVVVINIGTNDIAQNTGEYSPQFTMDCIRSMAELADYGGIKVILSSVTPAGEYPWRKEITNVVEKIDALNTQIKEYAESKGFAYIDYNSSMRDEDGALIKEYTIDGVHPIKEGYAVMEKIAKRVIDRELQ